MRAMNKSARSINRVSGARGEITMCWGPAHLLSQWGWEHSARTHSQESGEPLRSDNRAGNRGLVLNKGAIIPINSAEWEVCGLRTVDGGFKSCGMRVWGGISLLHLRWYAVIVEDEWQDAAILVSGIKRPFSFSHFKELVLIRDLEPGENFKM